MTVAPLAQWAPEDGAHWLHPQTSSRVPRRWVFLDTEAKRERTTWGERQHWRLGVTGLVTWSDTKKAWRDIVISHHATPGQLWEAVTAATARNQRTVGVAHNLAYDFRISQATSALPGLGWALDRPTMAGSHMTVEARKGDRSLLLVDSASYLPGSLARLGQLLGMAKCDLPDDDGTELAWQQRCEQDVRILARAYMVVVDWLDRDGLGSWARTGSSTGWHVMLRSHLADKVLVHARPEVREAEQAAMYAGRAEAWRWGTRHGERLYEWDYALAYANVCEQTSLPAQLEAEVKGVSLARMANRGDGYAWLVHAKVDQHLPVLPTSDELGVYWPTGTFTGWYWLPELVMAAQAGAEVKVGSAWRYRAAPWLSSWATWCMEQVAGTSSPEAAVRAVAAKHWTRAVPGRSAMRYRAWELAGEAYVPGVSYEPALDLDTGRRGAIMTIGDQRWEAWTTQWWDQALPQLLSAVMAQCRVRLWAAMQVAGLDHLAYCDTDSLIVDQAGHDRLDQAVAAGRLWSLRYKGHHDGLEIIAPQLVEGSSYRRLAGVPRGATRAARMQYAAEVWEGITTSMAAGHPDEVWVRKTQVVLSGLDTRRQHAADGTTYPFECTGGTRAVTQAAAAS